MILCVDRGSELVGAAEFSLMGGAPEDLEVECDLELLATLGRDDQKRREMAADRDGR